MTWATKNPTFAQKILISYGFTYFLSSVSFLAYVENHYAFLAVGTSAETRRDFPMPHKLTGEVALTVPSALTRGFLGKRQGKRFLLYLQHVRWNLFMWNNSRKPEKNNIDSPCILCRSGVTWQLWVYYTEQMFGFNPLFCVFVRRHLSDVELKKTPYAFVAVNLTDHEQITGFIFSAVFLSQRFQIGLERILNLGEAMGGYQDPTKCAAFDQAVTA